MPIKGDFISFSYNGVHSTELGVMRVTSSNRYTDALLPTIQDKTVQVSGSDGTYFFGSYYTQRSITITVAFDEVSESQIRLMRKTFGDGLSHELIFDDEPYKIYYAKATGTPQLQYIPFSTPRIYKGEGTFTFTCYDPFAHCKNSQKYLNEFPDVTTDVEMNENMVSFNNGVGNLKKVEVKIEPIQNLNGYSQPWPGGGGKNKYLIKDESRTSPGGLTITGDGNATIKVSGTSSASGWYESYISGGKFMLPAGTYTISARLTGTVPTPASGNTVRIGIFNNYVNVSADNPTRSGTFTISEPTEFFATGWFCAGTFDCTVQMQLEEGSRMTSWTPYSNICPITGRTGANVYRTGKNLLPSGGAFDVTVNGIRFVSDGNGTYTINGTATANAVYEFNIQEITLPSNVYLHMLNNASTYNVALVFLDGPTQIVAPTPVPVNAIKDLSTQLGGKTVNKLRLYVANGYTANITISPMLCIDNIATAYESYQGDVYPVTWQTEAGTVYGGTVDVVSGVLKAKPYIASYNGEMLVGPWVSSMDKYQAGTTPTIGAQVVDLGGFGTEYMLAPQEISTLVRQNYIWSNLGTNIDVVYKKVIRTIEYFKLEWNPSAQLLESKGTYDTYNSSTGFKLYNPGDVETDFKFIIPITNLLRGIKINDGVNDLASYTLLINAPTAKTGDSYLCFNSKLNLIEGLNSNKQRTGTVYNEYINSGSWFKIPLNRTGTNWYFKPIFSSTYSGNTPILEYDYLYF